MAIVKYDKLNISYQAGSENNRKAFQFCSSHTQKHNASLTKYIAPKVFVSLGLIFLHTRLVMISKALPFIERWKKSLSTTFMTQIIIRRSWYGLVCNQLMMP